MHARASRISHSCGKKQDFDFQFLAFNIVSLRKARAVTKQMIVSRFDARHRVSIHGHQDPKQTGHVEIIDQEQHVRPCKSAPREATRKIQTVLHQINTSGFAKGMYWVALQSNSGLITQKLIVQ